MINLHESIGPGRDRTGDPWICSQTRICSQTSYRLRYVARFVCALIGLYAKANQVTALAERYMLGDFMRCCPLLNVLSR